MPTRAGHLKLDVQRFDELLALRGFHSDTELVDSAGEAGNGSLDKDQQKALLKALRRARKGLQICVTNAAKLAKLLNVPMRYLNAEAATPDLKSAADFRSAVVDLLLRRGEVPLVEATPNGFTPTDVAHRLWQIRPPELRSCRASWDEQAHVWSSLADEGLVIPIPATLPNGRFPATPGYMINPNGFNRDQLRRELTARLGHERTLIDNFRSAYDLHAEFAIEARKEAMQVALGDYLRAHDNYSLALNADLKVRLQFGLTSTDKRTFEAAYIATRLAIDHALLRRTLRRQSKAAAEKQVTAEEWWRSLYDRNGSVLADMIHAVNGKPEWSRLIKAIEDSNKLSIDALED